MWRQLGPIPACTSLEAEIKINNLLLIINLQKKLCGLTGGPDASTPATDKNMLRGESVVKAEMG